MNWHNFERPASRRALLAMRAAQAAFVLFGLIDNGPSGAFVALGVALVAGAIATTVAEEELRLRQFAEGSAGFLALVAGAFLGPNGPRAGFPVAVGLLLVAAFFVGARDEELHFDRAPKMRGRIRDQEADERRRRENFETGPVGKMEKLP